VSVEGTIMLLPCFGPASTGSFGLASLARILVIRTMLKTVKPAIFKWLIPWQFR
jgi:hypothetical protein